MWKADPPKMASIRKIDRLDCVSSDTSSSVGASVGGVVPLVGGSGSGEVGCSHVALSVGQGFGTVLLLGTALEVLETLELGSCSALDPAVLDGKMKEELGALDCELGSVDIELLSRSTAVVTLDVLEREKGQVWMYR